MNYILSILSLFACSILLINCHQTNTIDSLTHSPDNKNILYTGRIDFSNPEKPKISGAAAYFVLKFIGSNCDILLEDQNLNNGHNYFTAEIDGEYRGRFRVSKEKVKYSIAKNLKDTVHSAIICKATESQTGYVELTGIICDKILPVKKKQERKIEFIGNSITCGMGIDISEITCDSGEWYDHHNAWLAYGPLVARSLDASWLLSSVSGIGMNRNWNSPGPTMPEVYKNTFLNTDPVLQWQYKSYIPDLVSVCLGQNDFSEGDGSYDRSELDSSAFVNDYIRFIEKIRKRYPETQICCLTSPMLSGVKSERLASFLSAVIKYMQEVHNETKMHLFRFSRSYVNGCDFHPDKEDHEMMAEELLPFFNQVMNW
jgi:hypothetical protein